MHRVHTSASVGDRKFAEKLTILVDRGKGILTRVYNIKKVHSHKPTGYPNVLHIIYFVGVVAIPFISGYQCLKKSMFKCSRA